MLLPSETGCKPNPLVASLLNSSINFLTIVINCVFLLLSNALPIIFMSESITSILPFGSKHNTNISYFLNDIMKNYTIELFAGNPNVINNDPRNSNRCIKIEKHIDVDAMIKDLTS
jgi:hypothetical protein